MNDFKYNHRIARVTNTPLNGGGIAANNIYRVIKVADTIQGGNFVQYGTSSNKEIRRYFKEGVWSEWKEISMTNV